MHALSMHRFFMRAALAAAQVFAWVLAFYYFQIVSSDLVTALLATLLVYIIGQLVTILLTPLSGRMLRHGFRRGMTYGTLAAAAGFMALGSSLQGLFGLEIREGIFLFALCFGAYRGFYWLPYGMQASAYERERPLTRFGRELTIGVLPLASGILFLLPSGMSVVMFSAGVLALMALPFLASFPERYEAYAWGYAQTFRMLANRRFRRMVISAFLRGVESAALFLFWPISIFLIIGEQWDAFGAVIAATLLVFALTRDVLRRILGHLRVRSALMEATVVFSAWIMRLAVGAPGTIIAVDTYYHLGSSGRHERPDAATLEQASDGGMYVDEITALKEIAFALGRIGTCTIAFVFISFGVPVALAVSLFVAGIAAAWTVFLARVHARVAY